MEEFENLLAKIGFVKKAAIKNDFSDIESLIGFNLPADYKYYINNYEPFEGDIVAQYVVLYDNKHVLAYNQKYNTDDHLSNTLLIGSNGASESIGIRAIDENNYQLVAAQYIHDVDDHIEIGVSFTDMLHRLVNGMMWFG